MSCSRLRSWSLVGVLAIASSACGGGAEATSSSASETAEPSAPVLASPTLPAAPLVGEWERETRCDEIVERLSDAGLERWVLDNAAAFVPGASTGADIVDPSQPCDGTVVRRHSHFFTADGRFGSRDEDGEDVDDGTYRMLDDRTFVISKEFPDVTFHYVVENDTVMFEPVIPDCAPDCFEAAWSVSVAYQGLPWRRVPGN